MGSVVLSPAVSATTLASESKQFLLTARESKVVCVFPLVVAFWGLGAGGAGSAAGGVEALLFEAGAEFLDEDFDDFERDGDLGVLVWICSAEDRVDQRRVETGVGDEGLTVSGLGTCYYPGTVCDYQVTFYYYRFYAGVVEEVELAEGHYARTGGVSMGSKFCSGEIEERIVTYFWRISVYPLK